MTKQYRWNNAELEAMLHAAPDIQHATVQLLLLLALLPTPVRSDKSTLRRQTEVQQPQKIVQHQSSPSTSCNARLKYTAV
jgi:hypothetical protein